MSHADTSHAGSIGFDAADRLAILNVVNSYAHFVDERPLEDFFQLFTDDAEMEFRHAGQLVAHGPEVRTLIRAQTEEVRRSKVCRRHVLNSVRLGWQDATTAQVQAYLQLYAISGGKCVLEAIGSYELMLMKLDGVWKISKWVGCSDWAITPGE